MSSATAAPPHKKTTPADLVHQMEANEWGQLTGLEPHAHYYVVRRPTVQMTREMSNQMMEELKAFAQQQREFAEKQVQEINEKVLPKALATVQQAREQVEKTVDQLTKEFETRVERLEAELGDRAPRFMRRKDAESAAPAGPEPTIGETPGEMPSGAESGNGASASSESKSSSSASKKKSGKKSE